VPSRLIGQRLTIYLYHDHLLGFVGTKQVVELPRMRVLAHLTAAVPVASITATSLTPCGANQGVAPMRLATRTLA